MAEISNFSREELSRLFDDFLKERVQDRREKNRANSQSSTQTPQTGTVTADSQGQKPSCCTSPQDVFVIGNALAALFAANYNQTQLETIINILVILQASLSSIVSQQELCEGIIIQPPE